MNMQWSVFSFVAVIAACHPTAPSNHRTVVADEAVQEPPASSNKCPTEDLEDCLSQAIGIFAGDGGSDQIRAMDLAGEACNRGYANACVSLGTWLEVGHTDSPDLMNEAFAVYLKGCDLGYASSCYHAGILLSRPHHYHMTENWPEAFRLLNLACVGGNCSACDELAVLHREGGGCTADAQRATVYQQRSYELGCVE